VLLAAPAWLVLRFLLLVELLLLLLQLQRHVQHV
jgi:hypothetical protein